MRSRRAADWRFLFALAAALVAVASGVYAWLEHARADGSGGAPRFVEAERPRAVRYAEDFARSCRPPCRMDSVEPIAPGVWRVHLNFANGYCVVIELDRFRRRANGTHEGWRSTTCTGPPRPR